MGDRLEEMDASVKQGVGKATGEAKTRARGAADRLKGDAQRTG